MKKKILFAFLVIASFYSCKEEHNNLPDGLYAKIETNKGEIIVQLDFEKAPITVANYVTLAEGKNEFVTNENLKNMTYPFTRILYFLTNEAYYGLGNGLIRFSCQQLGQIVVEKEGLQPYHIFNREVRMQ